MLVSCAWLTQHTLHQASQSASQPSHLPTQPRAHPSIYSLYPHPHLLTSSPRRIFFSLPSLLPFMVITPADRADHSPTSVHSFLPTNPSLHSQNKNALYVWASGFPTIAALFFYSPSSVLSCLRLC
ncbi:unnamed protein product [Periconia digitata]|uniref:Uncharacterized protein n=1 Tax=Periconia digitata TaxID=1303443 RepID=A0A9W4UTP2_9PLEO|nr:unnamed protein product [Periconia digitata]